MLMFTSTHRRVVYNLNSEMKTLLRINKNLNGEIKRLHEKYGVNVPPVQNSEGKWINPKTGRFVKYTGPKT